MSEHKRFDRVTLPELREEHRRILWDAEGFIVEGHEVLEDIRHQGEDYTEEIELVNMPPDFSERFKSNRVSSEHIAASGCATKIYEGISRENPDGIDMPSLFVAAAGTKGTIDPPAWEDAERLIQKVNQHLINLLGLCAKALGLDPTGDFEKLPKVPMGMRLKREFLPDLVMPESACGRSGHYMEIIEERLKTVRGARAKYIVLDRIMCEMASRMGFGDEVVAELDRFIAEVSEPKASGLVGVFGLE